MTNDYLRKILRYHEVAVSGMSGTTCVCVHGKPGTGKTALLSEAANSLLMSGSNVYFKTGDSEPGKPPTSHAGRSAGYDETGALKSLLRQLARMYGEDCDPELVQFVNNYVKGTVDDNNPMPKDALGFSTVE